MIIFEIDPNTFDGDNNPPQVNVEDIVLVNPKGNWHLYNHGSLELTKDCDKEYLNLWSYLPHIVVPNILIIGGGDYQLVKWISNYYDSFKIDLVDPYSHMCEDFHKFYIPQYYRIKNLVEPIHKTFKKFLEENYTQKKYDMICIDISEPMLGITNEIYCEQFFVDLKALNTEYYQMYMPPTVFNELVPILRKHFQMVSVKSDFIKDWNEQCDIITFINK